MKNASINGTVEDAGNEDQEQDDGGFTKVEYEEGEGYMHQ